MQDFDSISGVFTVSFQANCAFQFEVLTDVADALSSVMNIVQKPGWINRIVALGRNIKEELIQGWFFLMFGEYTSNSQSPLAIKNEQHLIDQLLRISVKTNPAISPRAKPPQDFY